eukprot:6359765-Amphidinium_carterae.1
MFLQLQTSAACTSQGHCSGMLCVQKLMNAAMTVENKYCETPDPPEPPQTPKQLKYPCAQ